MNRKQFLVSSFFLTFVLVGMHAANSASIGDPERLVTSGPAIRASANYWTPERMTKAKPYPVRSPTGIAKKNNVSRPLGPAGFGYSALPGLTISSVIEQTLPFASFSTTTPGYNYPPPFVRYQNFQDYSVFPYSTVCKVFFTDGGDDYVCSGSVWPSHSVITAGHCVYNDETHRYHTNVIVVPQYKNNQSPYGSFPATSLTTTEGWQDGDYAYDLGLIQTANKNGYKISYYTGNLGGRWNVTQIQHYTILGYPKGPPFNGATQQICQSSYAFTDPTFSPATTGVGCDLTGGSSGGPWVIKFSGNAGGSNQVNGVMSYGYNRQPKGSYSPYFGNAAKKLWDYARRN
jgi:V8-like Glu-specific endopeptidase